MNRNIRIAKRLVRIARMLVADDDKLLEQAIQKGSSMPDEQKEEVMEVVNGIVDKSGDSDAKRLLDQIVNAGSRQGRRRMSSSLIDRIMEFSGNSRLVRALLVAAAMAGAISSAEAKDVFFRYRYNPKTNEVYEIDDDSQWYDQGEHQKSSKYDRQYAEKTAKEIAMTEKEGMKSVTEKDGFLYISVTFRPGEERDAKFMALSALNEKYFGKWISNLGMKQSETYTSKSGNVMGTTFIIPSENIEK